MSDMQRDEYLDDLVTAGLGEKGQRERDDKIQAKQEAIVDKLRRRGTIAQQHDDMMYDQINDPDFKKDDGNSSLKTTLEDRRDNYFRNARMRRRQDFAEAALPKEAKRVLKEQEAQFKFNDSGFLVEKGDVGSRLAEHEARLKSDQLAQRIKEGKARFEGKTDVDITTMFEDIPKPHKWAEDDEIDEIQTEMENRLVGFYIDWVELQTYIWQAKGRDDCAGFFSAPLTLFFLGVAFLEHAMVAPIMWLTQVILEIPAIAIAGLMVEGVKTWRMTKLATLLGLSPGDVEFQFNRAMLSPGGRFAYITGISNKCGHFIKFAFAYIRYALWRYVGFRIITYLYEALMFPIFLLVENLNEVGEVHQETGIDCLLYLKSTTFHPAEKIGTGKDGLRYGGEEIWVDEIAFGDLSRTVRVKVGEFFNRVIRLGFIEAAAPTVWLLGITVYPFLGYLDSLTLGMWDIGAHTDLTLLRINRSEPAPMHFEEFRNKGTYLWTRFRDKKRRKIAKVFSIQTFQMKSIGGGFESLTDKLLNRHTGQPEWLEPREDGIAVRHMEYWGERQPKRKAAVGRSWFKNMPFNEDGSEIYEEDDVRWYDVKYPPKIRRLSPMTLQAGVMSEVSGYEFKRDVVDNLLSSQGRKVIHFSKGINLYTRLHMLVYDKLPPTMSGTEIRSEMQRLEIARLGDQAGQVLRERARGQDQRRKFEFYNHLTYDEIHQLGFQRGIRRNTHFTAMWFQRYIEILNRYGDALHKERQLHNPTATQHMWAEFVRLGCRTYLRDDPEPNGRAIDVSEYPDETLLGIRMVLPFKVTQGINNLELYKHMSLVEDGQRQCNSFAEDMEYGKTVKESKSYGRSVKYITRLENRLGSVKESEAQRYLRELARRNRIIGHRALRENRLWPVFNACTELNVGVGNALSETLNDFARRDWLLGYLFEYHQQVFHHDRADTFFLTNDYGELRHDGAERFMQINHLRKQNIRRWWEDVSIDFEAHLANSERMNDGGAYATWVEYNPNRASEEMLLAAEEVSANAIRYMLLVEMYALEQADFFEDRRGKHRPIMLQQWFHDGGKDTMFRLILEPLMLKRAASGREAMPAKEQFYLKEILPPEKFLRVFADMYISRTKIRANYDSDLRCDLNGIIMRNYYEELFSKQGREADAYSYGFVHLQTEEGENYRDQQIADYEGDLDDYRAYREDVRKQKEVVFHRSLIK